MEGEGGGEGEGEGRGEQWSAGSGRTLRQSVEITGSDDRYDLSH